MSVTADDLQIGKPTKLTSSAMGARYKMYILFPRVKTLLLLLLLATD